ncbi:MAG: 16S rRNA (cytidine(1402)-2'-O)-methyltransferase, partial [Bacteroidota bacterium]|nr:16S rRNA (cytidine(1402)-2'-O)-methyltransferase [Bacteroidota bacterium]
PERKDELRALHDFPEPTVFLDAPYRLVQVLEDMTAAFGSGRRAAVAVDLTLQSEEVRRGTLQQLRDHYRAHRRKCEFVIIVDGAPQRRRHRR